MRQKTRRTISAMGIIVALIAIVEISMRLIWGFCDAPLYMASDEFEYICAPNQDRHRFGHHIVYNSFSQRSDEPDSSRVIVLGLGDSVINGGVMTDNDSLATSLASSDKVQILNISAGSWGPDNCAAYLRHYGTFGAKKMLLVVGSGDAYDCMDFIPVVDIHKSCRSKQYFSAIWELVDRYALPIVVKPKLLDPDQKALQGVGIRKNGKEFNPGFDYLKAVSDSLSIPLSIYLHPDIAEFNEGKYNDQGDEILSWAAANGVNVCRGLDMPDLDANCYRDGIHLNERGQKVLSSWMKSEILGLSNAKPKS